MITVPAIPVRLASEAMKWATRRIGPAAWVILLAVAGSGAWWYCQQPPDRRDRIRHVAGQVGTRLLEESAKAMETVEQARLQLRASVVSRPGQRTPASAILRELALSPDSLSAAQIADLLDPSVRPPVADLRAFLRAHDGTVFDQVRRGGFVLGSHYQLPG